MRAIIILFLFPISLIGNNLIGYWHNWDDSNAPFIHLDAVDSRYDVVIVAFGMPASINDMAIQFVPERTTQAEFISKMRSLQNQGRKVLLSIGGANATIDLTTTTNRNAFISSVNNLMSTYGFDGIDIDIENGNSILITGGTISSPTNIAQINLIEAIRQIMSNYRSSFNRKLYLTMAPETAYVQGGQSGYGNIWGGYLPIIHALRDSISILQVQLYNSGSMYGLDGAIYYQGTGDFIVALTEAVIRGFNTSGGFFTGLPSNKIAIGLPASQNAAGGGFVDSTTLFRAMKYLIGEGSRQGNYSLIQGSGYPNIFGMMTWSINWDATQSNRTKYQYANVFEQIFEPTTISLPDVVTLILPQDNSNINISSTNLRWNKSKPNVTAYHLEIISESQKITNDTTLADTTFGITNLISGKRYYWRLRAKNSSGWGNWSQTRTFLISIKPNKPTLKTPAMDEIVKKKSVVFSWNKSFPVGTTYELQLLLSGVVVFKDTALTDTALVFVDTKPDSRYNWYVRAKNQAGWSEWSGIRSFSTIQLPSKVELIEPVYNANLKTDTVLFTWEKPAGDISNYSIEIYSSGILIKADSNLTDTCFKASLIRKHEYKWRVLAGNDFGNGPWSIERPFFLSEKEHKLTVQNGEGSGNYNTGDKIKINAIVPDSSMEFLYWSGDTDFVENKALQVTYVTIPNRDLVVSANFTEKFKYELIIQNGTGSGKYYSGTRVKIEAEPPQSNYKFIVWTGNTECLDDSSAATTYATIPSINIVLTAKYELMSSIPEFNQLFDFSISPNPASDYIEIKLSNVIPAEAGIQVLIFDILGIEQSTPVSYADTPAGVGHVWLDVSSLPTGVYFVRIGDVVKKFVKM